MFGAEPTCSGVEYDQGHRVSAVCGPGGFLSACSACEAVMHAHMPFLLSMASAGFHGHTGDDQTLSSGDNSIQKT